MKSFRAKRLQGILTGKLEALKKAQAGLKNAEAELQIKREAVIKLNDDLSQYSLGDARLDNLNQTAPLLIEWLEQEKQILGDRVKLTKLNQEVEAVEKAYETANFNCKNYDAEYLKARTELETARQENHAATLRLSLHDGDNCPVCGGIYPEAHLLPELQATQRYSLKYADDKKYYVEDNWNGGESRKVQTLSGGETFATSLSLALALSDRLSRGAKLGSLFIDEGFGTLDAETLQSVSNILQTLGQQDKLVGVITHVPALGEELGAQIKVEKSQEGSRIVVLGTSN